ncbi:MAG: TIGR02453 family protein [Actinomycetota bacterium]|nr:TIGR02453 family protein [Actinomycetota bacterium]
MGRRYFTKATFEFLSELATNNERAWFDANRKRYEAHVKEPALDFIDDFRVHLTAVSPRFEANARANGGSLFRIHRDTRFGKDKTPYKTNTGLHFRHERAKDVHAPGFYLHIEPRGCFAGAGLWHPQPATAQAIRTYRSDHRDRWTSVTGDPALTARFSQAGDSLSRPPNGFAKDDLLIEDLKRKDFLAMTSLTQRELTSASFLDDFGQLCGDTAPFMRFLCDSLDLAF